MTDRQSLGPSERAALWARYENGDHSMVLVVSEECPIDILAAPFDPSGECPVDALPPGGSVLDAVGAVRIGDHYLTPDEARRVAAALLSLADHAEFGPGEWRDGRWRRTER